MFLKKELPEVPVKTVLCQARFDGKQTDGFVEKISQNTVVEQGSLCSARGFSKVLDLHGLTGACDSPFGLVCCTTHGVKKVVDNNVAAVSAQVLTKPVFWYSELHQKLYLTSVLAHTYSYDGTSWNQIFDKGFCCLAELKERLFGVDGSTLYFTERDDFSQWSGFVELPEKVCSLVVKGDKIWAVGDALYEIDFNDELCETTVREVCRNLDSPFGGTVQKTADRLIFLNACGLFCYSHGRLSRLLEEEKLVPSEKAVAAVLGNRYYLACSTEGGSNNLLLEIDCQTLKTVSRRVCAFEGVFAQSRLLAVGKNTLFTLGNDCLPLFWQSEPCFFGDAYAKKQLKSLLLEVEGNVVVQLVSEHGRRIYHVTGSGAPQKIAISGSCGRLSVEIYSETAAKVNSFAILAEMPQKSGVMKYVG